MAETSACVTYLSGTLGAKQLVVVRIQRIFPAPSSWTFLWISSRFVLSSSPSLTFSMTTSSNPVKNTTQLYTNVLHDMDNNIKFSVTRLQCTTISSHEFSFTRFHSLHMDNYLSIVFNDTNLK